MQAAHPYTVQDQCEWHTLTPCKISASGTPLHSARSVRVAHSYTVQDQCEWHTLTQCKISVSGTPLHSARSVEWHILTQYIHNSKRWHDQSMQAAHPYTVQNQCEWHTLAQCKISGVAHPYTVQDQWRGTPLHNAKSV